MGVVKKVFDEFIYGNYFIALCALAMIYTTFLLCHIPLQLTPATVFVTSATFLLYNFHKHSFKIDYSSRRTFFSSAMRINLQLHEKIAYVVAILITAFYFFRLHENIYPVLVPLTLLAVAYSAPLFRTKGKKVRLKEVFFIKTPLLALVWALTTTVIPLVEQNISLMSAFVWWQILSRTLFIFALCIPFEMRDIDVDRKNNISTLAVAHGKRSTQIIGVVIIVVEILTHHMMNSIPFIYQVSLDLSSVAALLFILMQNDSRSGYYYKFMTDGAMILRFLFLYLAFLP